MRKLFYAIVLFGLIGLSGCALNKMVKMADDQQLTVTPNPLEVHADTVAFDMAANLPVKMLKKDKVYTVRTFYNYGDGEVELEPLEFRAEDFPNADDQQPKKSQQFSFPYSEGMNPGTLEVMGVASNPKNGKTQETERMVVAPGVITTSQLVETTLYPAFADHGYNNQEELIPTNVNFYFLQGSSALRYSERRGDRGKQLDAYIAGKNATKTVTITGTHSPEGPERVNSDLSKNRAEAIEKFYRNEMSKYDYMGKADSIEFITKDVVEDWTIFKDSLASYDGISSEEKSAYLNIVNGSGSFEEKEDQLHKLSTYNKVFRDLYPQLRTAKTEILTVKEKKTDSEISVLSKQIVNGSANADTLSNEELLYSATLTPSLTEKETIYKASIKKEDTWVAHNNLAATYISMAWADMDRMTEFTERAQAQVDIAAGMEDESPEILVNQASVSMMMGNPYKAYSSLQKAMSMSPSNELTQGANGIKGSAEIMMAKYTDAVRSLSNANESKVNTFNLGLAQLLNKDYESAFSTLWGDYRDNYSEKDELYGKAAYVTAVAGSRNQAGGQEVAKALSEAVSADPSLKEKALNDLAFAPYKDNQEFVNALK